VQVGDPVGSGFVASFQQPGGNATGFNSYPPTLTSKWLELVQMPVRFELVVNLKTAKAMDLKIPESFLVRATR